MLICDVFFVLIIASDKVVSSNNYAQTFLYQKSTNFLTLLIGKL